METWKRRMKNNTCPGIRIMQPPDLLAVRILPLCFPLPSSLVLKSSKNRKEGFHLLGVQGRHLNEEVIVFVITV